MLQLKGKVDDPASWLEVNRKLTFRTVAQNQSVTFVPLSSIVHGTILGIPRDRAGELLSEGTKTGVEPARMMKPSMNIREIPETRRRP